MEDIIEKQGKIILVAGATGKQGGSVTRHLQEKGWKVRALTRNPNGKAAQALASEGIDIVKGDMGDLQSLEKAMDNTYGVFSVQDFWIVGVKEEIQQGKNMADAAKKAGVQHFVYSSAAGADRESGVDHFDSKFVIEEYVRNIDLQATILRPVGFMENYHIPCVENGILRGKLAHPIVPDKKIQLIPTDDIGALVAAAYEKPEKFIGLAFDIASDELTNPEIAQTFGRVMGRPIRYNKLPMLIVRLFMGKELHQMFRWINKVGYDVDIPALRSNYPEVKFTSLEEWLRRDGWDKRAS
ncbi:MAG: NmrA/HSCARG family protein [Candidatus Electryonea clarkiae]|nr:NmrA/HSCARG family protein [Candidatus Electryonea clarkiae]MDP8287153.1 NmrA/HSCARG family protein [Candidatus Electryonea clarkiae]